jgi:hypothetical protein
VTTRAERALTERRQLDRDRWGGASQLAVNPAPNTG